MRTAAKVDANQPEIVQALRQAGFHVCVTSRLGDGFPDLVVTGNNRHTGQIEALLVEVKTAKGKLTPDERDFLSAYPDDGPYIIARTFDDVLTWFGAT